MNKKTREALEGSIRKWEEILASRKKEGGISDCPLCPQFRGPSGIWHCDGCPVRAASGKAFCEGTPYEDWSHHQKCRRRDGNRNAYRATDKRSRELAEAELDFLKSLRPDDD